LKKCSQCKEALSLDSFYADGRAKDGLQSACKDCGNAARWKIRECKYCGLGMAGTERNQMCNECAPPGVDYHRWAKILFRFKLTHSMWWAMYFEQDGQCAISSCSNEATHVDHDHMCCFGRDTCGRCVRALLCMDCNTKLSAIEDTVFLNSANEYLATYSK
jgi:hypothetical protein